MALDKLVDSTQLDSDLTSVANAIRTKGGTSAQLAFPAGFVSAIGDIPSGETVYTTERGHLYTKNLSVETTNAALEPGYLNGQWFKATEMETARLYGTPWTTSVGLQSTFDGCTKLTDATIEQVKRFSSYVFIRCSALKNVQLGRIGNGVVALSNTFYGLTQRDLTITIYVDDGTTIPLANSPWGATNATIIYKSSTDGSVRTP